MSLGKKLYLDPKLNQLFRSSSQCAVLQLALESSQAGFPLPLADVPVGFFIAKMFADSLIKTKVSCKEQKI